MTLQEIHTKQSLIIREFKGEKYLIDLKFNRANAHIS